MLNVVGAVLIGVAAVVGAALIVLAAVRARRGSRVAVGADSAQATSAGGGSYGPPRPNVVGWRFARLLSAGVDARLALHLAEQNDTDIHAVVALMRRGCPAPLAARIIAPLPRRARR